MFYLCKVVGIEISQKRITDDYNHTIPEGLTYLLCNYLEKVSERRAYIKYKLLPKVVFVLPSQVMNPIVEMNANLQISIEEYQWLLDSV